MRKRVNFALLIWLSLASLSMSMSNFALAGVNRWTRIGLEGAGVTALAIDSFTPVTIYAGTRRLGIFKSIDGGESWTDINNGLPYAYSASRLLIDPLNPNTIYSDGFNSIDGGESWTVIVNEFEYRNLVALAIDPVETNTLYAADRKPGPGIWDLFPGNLYKSTDGGESWRTINNGLPGDHAHILVIDPLITTTLYASLLGYGRYGVYKSTDGGENWTVINNGLTFITSDGEIANSLVWAMVINSNTPDTLYAGTEFQGVFKSTDGGESWTAINDGLTNLSINALAIDPINPTTIYAGIDGVYRYEDLGTNASDLLDSLDSLDSSDSSDSFDFFCLISTSAGGFREVKNELAIFLLLISGLIVFAIIRWIYRDQEP